MVKYIDFVVVSNEGDGIVGQFKTLSAAKRFALEYEAENRTNVTIAREVFW
jgi:hypothetical protein